MEGPDSPTGLTVELLSSCSVNPGDQVEVDFTAGGPSVPGNFDFTVMTSDNATPATSNILTVGTTPPTLSAASYVLGSNTSYLLSGAAWTTLSQPFTALVLTAKATSGTSISWYDGVSGYSVTYTPAGGAATPDAVNAVSLSTTTSANDTVTLTLAAPLTQGDSLSIMGRGTNPATTSSDVISVSPEAVVNSVAQFRRDDGDVDELAVVRHAGHRGGRDHGSAGRRRPGDIHRPFPGHHPATRWRRCRHLSERARRADRFFQRKGRSSLRHDGGLAVHRQPV